MVQPERGYLCHCLKSLGHSEWSLIPVFGLGLVVIALKRFPFLVFAHDLYNVSDGQCFVDF